MALTPTTPEPRYVVATDGVRIATYEDGDPADPPVVLVHGFASSTQVNWYDTGWARELLRAGFRVISLDQRGHGRSDKPHESDAYSMPQLVADVTSVLDAHLLSGVGLVGYSLGARVGWHTALRAGDRVHRAVLGGIPDGYPLTRFRVDQAEAFLADGTPIEDRLTRAYLDIAGRDDDNDLAALVALVTGMRGSLQPDPEAPPRQPVLFATGSDDGILEASRRLAAATPAGDFVEIPGRNHFNAPTSRHFRDEAIAFLRRPLDASQQADRSPAAADSADETAAAAVVARPDGAETTVSRWEAGVAAMALLLPAELRGTADRAAREAMLRARWSEWQAALDADRAS